MIILGAFPILLLLASPNHLYDVDASASTSSLINTYSNRHLPPMFQSFTSDHNNIGSQILDYNGEHPFELYQQEQNKRTLRNNDNDNNNDNEQQEHRQLNETENIFAPSDKIRIKTDTSQILSTVKTAIDQIRFNHLQNVILPNVIAAWEGYLSPRKPVVGTIKVPSSACFGIFEKGNGYEGLPKNLKNVGVADADIVILVSQFEFVQNQLVCPTDEEGDIFAAATYCSLDQFDRPIIGFINLCLNKIDVEEDGLTISQHTTDTITGVLIHEFAHAFGLNSDSLKYFRDVKSGEPLTPRPFQPEKVKCVDGKEYDNIVLPSKKTIRAVETRKGSGLYYEIVTAQVQQVARNQFDCQELVGARLENQPTGSTCFGSHFDERHYFTESLSAIFAEEANYFSAMTLAFLEDTGWYTPNYLLAEVSPFGHGAGCEFVNENCILGGIIPDYSKGFFCNKVRDNVESPEEEKNDYICDPAHTHKALCDLRPGVTTPDDYRLFPGMEVGPTISTADWCPVASDQVISCQDPNNAENYLSLQGETFGADSRCFETTASNRASVCLQSNCNEETRQLEVTMNGQTLICNEDFKTIVFSTVDSFLGLVETPMWIGIECPRLAAACPSFYCPGNCAGKGVCNYNVTEPRCECFDKNDTSAGCYFSAARSAKEPTIVIDGDKSAGVRLSALTVVAQLCALILTVSLFS